MPTQPPVTPPATRRPAPASSSPRYVDLVGRLRGRQITMEEATELFEILEAMLRESLVVRARLEATRSMAAGPAPAPSRPTEARPAPRSSDDLLLLGLLALGAGAGLGAAFSRRLAESGGRGDPPSPPSGATGRTRAER